MYSSRICILSIFLFLLSIHTLYPNPFLGSEESQKPAPVAMRSGASDNISKTQISIRERIAESLSAFKKEKSLSSIAIILFSAFLYGILHAAGPGHRKTVVFSLFLAKQASVWEPLAAGLVAALAHSGTAMLLIALLSSLSGALASIVSIDSAAIYMEGFSFAAIALIGIFLSARKVWTMFISRTRHQHGMTTVKNGKNIYMLIAVTSLVPCPAATMIVMLAIYLDLLTLGIFSVLCMSIGMSLVISGAAYLAYFGRESLFLRFKSKETLVASISDALELVSYIFLTVFAVYTVLPFVISLFEGR